MTFARICTEGFSFNRVLLSKIILKVIFPFRYRFQEAVNFVTHVGESSQLVCNFPYEGHTTKTDRFPTLLKCVETAITCRIKDFSQDFSLVQD